MGVYIKGMEMPKNCESCQFRRCISDLIMFSRVGCQLDVGMAKKEAFKGRHPNCPLVEVKAPHGDLIDRGDLLAFLNENLSTHPDALSWSDYGVIDLVEARSTVIEAEGKDDG